MNAYKAAGRGILAGWLIIWFLAAILSLFLLNEPGFDLARTLRPPAFAHPLGFDTFGRDLLPVVLRASLHSSGFAVIAVAIAVIAGGCLGTALALSTGKLRFVCLRLLEGGLAFPYLLVALGFAAIQGPGWGTLLFALLFGTLPQFTRLIYVRSIELLSEGYVSAARALGSGKPSVAFRHIMPALLPLGAIKLPALFAQALMAEATLTFLGIGAPIGRDTWGSLLAQGKEYLIEAPHIAIVSGIPLVLTILALQIISERHAEKHFRRD